MNKKYFLAVIVLSVFTISLVSAIALTYYAQHTETINVIQPISVNGIEGYTESASVGCNPSETCPGSELAINNKGSAEVPVNVLTTNEDGEVNTAYNAETTLTQKTVDFSLDVWEVPEGALTATLNYKIIDDVFTAEVTNPIVGYELIYYKDNSDRFASPAKAIRLSEVSQNLPYLEDKNLEDYDYCATEEYVTCHGAKIWYVPTDTILEGGELNWARASEFYFETELIQFNSEGELIIYPGQTLSIVPEYYVLPTALSGAKIVITEILPTA